ncbi:hypothetical protein HPE56_12125 [Maribacter sp. ANRC-HE7]|uniref:Outer membrane protein beta-barrel domain-containing protein n=1 Tax=Maribacter aquimaris TaxID=2737171 RepID=A0ABR7V187_9FLAO|nr:hypothetical protein [Maribacter aquimaris]MBD0778543.1 hypothetical protein [Maribacter aquimaris]
MRVVIIYLMVLFMSFGVQKIFAQEENENLQYKIGQLEKAKSEIILLEKEALKTELEFINQQLDKNDISKEEAQKQKKVYAEKHAKNIENKLTIIDSQIALLERNGVVDLNTDSNQLMIGINAEDDHGNRLFGVKYNSGNQNKIVYDKRTYSDLVVAFGLNNESNGNVLSGSPFKITGSKFFEIGYAWNTRVFKNTNWLRLKYGVSFQFNGFKPNNKYVYMTNTDLGNPYAIILQDFNEATGSDVTIKKSKLRMDSFIFPIHFEFGPSNKKVNGKYVRYSTDKNFKFGIGGYWGINYNTIQKVKFSDRTQIAVQNLSNIFYKDEQTTVRGLSAYAGYGEYSLYLKFETSSSIRKLMNQNVISLGLRFDL